MANYYVTPTDDGWEVQCEGEEHACSTHDTLHEAVRCACELAFPEEGEVLMRDRPSRRRRRAG